MLAAMGPVAVLLINWTNRWSDPPDWMIVGQVAAACAITGGVAYWRKYRALIQLPPLWAAARDLAQQVKTVTTTETLERTQNPPGTIKTTVEETKVTSAPVEPQSAPLTDSKGN
jgi:hypothetical protein